MSTLPSYRIVVVDDDYSTLRLLQLTLQKSCGHRVTTYDSATDFFAARDALRSAAYPDIILLSLSSDSIDPLATFASVRRRFKVVPVVILTGPGEHDSAEEALRRGAADYFSRPIDLRRLRHVLPRIVRAAELESSEVRGDVSVPVQSMDAVKEAAVRSAIAATAGNVKEAARMLDIGRTTIYKLMERYGIEVRSSSSPAV